MKLSACLKKELLGFLTLVFPPLCPLCRERNLHSLQPGLCDNCLDSLTPLTSPCCTLCCLPFDGPAGSDHLCENCLKQPPPFSGVAAFGLYEGLLREAIHKFKYEEALHLQRPLGLLLARALEKRFPSDPPDLIVPIPLSLHKLRERTYNQALLLARTLGKRLDVPIAVRGMEKTRDTLPQQGLNLDERKRNLKGAFAWGSDIQGRNILLVDDILTTGTTARECSRTLLKGGAADVRIAVLARTPKYQ